MFAEEAGLVVASAVDGDAQTIIEFEEDVAAVGPDVEPPVGSETEDLAATGAQPPDEAVEADGDAQTVVEPEEDAAEVGLDVAPPVGSETADLAATGAQPLDGIVETEQPAGEVIDEVLPLDAGDLPADADEPVPPDGRAWYVIHCYSGYENKVKHNLEQRIDSMQMQSQIFQVVIPTEDEIEVRDGKRRTVERRVFPGYILVQMIQTDDSWYVVRNTPGVTGFVGMGNEPTPLTTEEVQSIMKRMEAEAPRIKVAFKPGERVRIIEGPFNEFIGQVEELDMTRAKVRVLVSFFGRETPVELDFLQVEKT